MKFRILGILLVTLIVFILAAVLAFELYHADRIYPGVSVWGIDVGGMRREEAAAVLESQLGIQTLLITLHSPDRSWPVRPADLGVRLDLDATLAPAYAVGRTEAGDADAPAHLQLLAYGEDLSPVIVYDDRVARLYLETLAEQIDAPPTDATLSLEGTTPVIHPAQAGRYLDVEATLALLAPAVTTLQPINVPLVIHEIPPPIADAEPARAEAEALLAGPLTLLLSSPREGDPGPWIITPEQLVPMLIIRAEGGALHTELDRDALRAHVASIAPSLAIEPVDARFDLDTQTGQLSPISPSQEGRALDVEASTERIMQGLAVGNRYTPLVLRSVPPRYPDTATAGEMGVTDLVAEGESYFIGSPAGRDHNIRLSASKFHGIVVPPGEIFSFNTYLGPVTAEEGYDESYITAGEQLAIEVGGGICQVSTTVFRAAFWGGYPIVERYYHYQRIGYYELVGGKVGMDATVYSPSVDFRFRNDRPHPLLIQVEIDEQTHRLTFRFYSTDDGRRVEMEGPELSDETEPGPPIYQLDEDLEPGTVVKWQSAVNGVTATIDRWVYDAGGNLIRHDTFVSKYAPRRAAYHYGPGYTPPEP